MRAERLRLSEEQGQRILRLYHLYRLTIGLVLVLLISSELEDQVLKLVHPELFHVGSWCYLVFNILVALFLPPSRQLLPIFILALTDVLMLCGLFYAGGGVPSGIGSLLVVAVAIANILLRGRIGLVIAAAASLGLLYLTFFLSLSSPDATNHYVQAGGLGTLCFAAALVIQALVRRQEQTETLAEERAETVANLEELNALILQRMRTGILVVDSRQAILLANQAALGLLRQDDVQGASLGRHSPMLMHCMKQWRLNPSLRPPTLKVVPDGPTVQPSFISLNREDDQHVLIFLEDISQIAQQAQQMKLAGLGRLTAGIAHEIRNPLGAISHAAQLLQESEELDAPDRRLTQIIQDQSKRMNLVIENVLQLSRRRQAEPQQLDLKEWLQRFVDEYPGRLRNDSQLHLQLGAGDIQTRMDPHPVEPGAEQPGAERSSLQRPGARARPGLAEPRARPGERPAGAGSHRRRSRRTGGQTEQPVRTLLYYRKQRHRPGPLSLPRALREQPGTDRLPQSRGRRRLLPHHLRPPAQTQLTEAARMSRQKALIVDDEPDIRELLEITLGRMKLDTRSARNVKEARELLAREPFDLCLTDMRLPDGSGLDLVQYIQQRHPQTPVAMITAYGSLDTAIQALKAGAFDFLTKPVDLGRLRELVATALRLRNPEAEEAPVDNRLLGESPPMRALRNQIGKLARSQAPVYISGESGSGKELVARLIHEQGPRIERPFVPVNCGAIPSELMESEFFGHKKGSFTGAIEDKQGLFQAASGGTLFLDEVADLPMAMQVKLLRAIQEKAVRAVGGQQEVAVDVRILCATHKDLAAEVGAGRFRQDLYYRLNVIELRVPPLRERREDIPLLAERILKRLAGDTGLPAARLTGDAQEKLKNYRFPGNVRELENMLERAYTLCEDDQIQPHDLRLADAPGASQEGAASLSEIDNLEDYLEDIERKLIMQALEETRWNRTAAAQRLGLTFRSMRYRLKKLGID